MKSIIIIGGGLGGLFTGAILSKEGYKVTVIEKNATIGGGLQTFRRFGVSFDTGMHIIGGMQPGGSIRRICKYLGIIDKVAIKDVDNDCTDALYFEEDNKWYKLGKGKEGFVNSLSKYFPEERAALNRYVEDIYNIVEEIDLFHLRPSKQYLVTHSEDFIMYADEFIARYFKDEKLRSIVAYTNPLYGGRANQTPAYIHAIVNVLYINGPSRFVDDSQQFAELLVNVITNNGGSVVKSNGVTHVNVNDRHVTSVTTSNGEIYKGDLYISAIHPCALLPIIDEGAFPKSYRNRLESIPNSYSAFGLYIKLKPNSFRYINHSVYYMTKYDEIWNFGCNDRPWPLGFLFMTPPESNQGEYANKALITAPMLFEAVKEWETTTVGHRGESYNKWKEKMSQLLLEKVNKIFPDFTDCIEAINSSSPLTIRDFYGSKEGCLSGFSKDAGNMALSQVPVVTKVDNLYLTGQNNNLHGFCGVPLTAIKTCEAIMGMNYIVNKINECEE